MKKLTKKNLTSIEAFQKACKIIGEKSLQNFKSACHNDDWVHISKDWELNFWVNDDGKYQVTMFAVDCDGDIDLSNPVEILQ